MKKFLIAYVCRMYTKTQFTNEINSIKWEVFLT